MALLFVCSSEERFTGKSERLVILSRAQRNAAAHVFFHAVVDFLHYRPGPVCCGDFTTSDAARSVSSSELLSQLFHYSASVCVRLVFDALWENRNKPVIQLVALISGLFWTETKAV